MANGGRGFYRGLPGIDAVKDISVSGGRGGRGIPSISFDRGDSESPEVVSSSDIDAQSPMAQLQAGPWGSTPSIDGTPYKPPPARRGGPYTPRPPMETETEVPSYEDPGSIFEAEQRLAVLMQEAEAAGGVYKLDKAKQARISGLSSFIEGQQEESARNEWLNTLQGQILPSLFTNPFDRIQADREYGFALEQEQREDERFRRESSALAQEQLNNQRSRENAFNVMATLGKTFPALGIDTSAFDGELDPALLGPLVQIALAKATQRNQRMAQPVVRFA